MEDGNLLAKAGNKATGHLRRQGDFRHQHDGRFPFLENPLNHLQINFRLAAPCNPLQKVGLGLMTNL